MKIDVRDNVKKNPLPYPKLMKSTVTGAVALMIEDERGTIIADPGGHTRVGMMCEGFVMVYWEDFHGEVVISQ